MELVRGLLFSSDKLDKMHFDGHIEINLSSILVILQKKNKNKQNKWIFKGAKSCEYEG